MATNSSRTLAPSLASARASDRADCGDVAHKISLLEARLEILEGIASRDGGNGRVRDISPNGHEAAIERPDPELARLEFKLMAVTVLLTWLCVGWKLFTTSY